MSAKMKHFKERIKVAELPLPFVWKIIVHLEGGLVQDITGIPNHTEVVVMDYDITEEPNEDNNVKKDDSGNLYAEIIFTREESPGPRHRRTLDQIDKTTKFLAELPLSSETEGVQRDYALDELLMAARDYIKRIHENDAPPPIGMAAQINKEFKTKREFRWLRRAIKKTE